MASLPIPNELTFVTYEGYTGSGPLSFDFAVFSKADLRVQVGGAILDASQFTFEGVDDYTDGYNGGTISLVTPATANDVTVFRLVVTERTTDFAPTPRVPVASLDNQLDRLTAMIQDCRRDIGRADLAPYGQAGGDLSGTDLSVYATIDYVNSVAVANPAGIFNVTRVNGTVDLTGYNGKTVRLMDGVMGDMNVWQVLGMSPGQRATVLVNVKTGFIFGSDLAGTNIKGHYQGVARYVNDNRMGTMPVGPDDVLEFVCQPDGMVRVCISENQFIDRVSWQAPGSSREPLESYYTIGVVGTWDDDKGIPYGDALFPIQGTIRKPIFGGLFLRGGGDSSSIFFENYAIEGQDEGAGLDSPGYCIPWDDYKKIGNRIAWVAKVANGTGKIVACDAIIGPGAPGSLNQGEYATVGGYAAALPTLSSTPGGVYLQSTPTGINCPIDRLYVASSGSVVILGQAAMETFAPGGSAAAAFIAATGGGRLTGSNGDQWHAPSLDILREGPHYGDLQMYASPAESGRQYAAWSVREYGAHLRGVDFVWRSDEHTHWLMSVAGNVRTRVWGASADTPGVLLHGGGGKTQFWYRGLADDDFEAYFVGGTQAGRLEITLNDSTLTLDIAFSTDGGGAISKFNTTTGSNALFDVAVGAASAGSGTDGKITVYVNTAGYISVSNRSGIYQNLRMFFRYG